VVLVVVVEQVPGVVVGVVVVDVRRPDHGVVVNGRGLFL